MRISSELAGLAGTWQGKNLLWLYDPQPIKSATTATVRLAAGGTCLCIEYVWSYEGEAQAGMLLMGSKGAEAVQGIWRDSFHSSAAFLISDGKAEGLGGMQVLGHYGAPPDADWGWRTCLRADGEDCFEIAMVNISPGGEETPAVRMEFERVVGSE